jgi:hypothetical protein
MMIPEKFRITTTLRTAALAAALGIGVATMPAAAQDATPEDDPVAAAATPEEEDEGFNDWGLLGLLGLGGLAGLLNRNRSTEVRTVDRTTEPRI